MKKVSKMQAKTTSLYFSEIFPINVAIDTGIFRIPEIGKKIKAPKLLNSTCTKAKAIAASGLYIDAMTAVMVVPMFAPMIKGNTLLKLTFLLATSGTTKEVVTVLD